MCINYVDEVFAMIKCTHLLKYKNTNNLHKPSLQKKLSNQVPRQEMAQRSIPTSVPAVNPGRKLPLNQNGPIPNIPQTQSPVLRRNADSLINNEKLPGSSTKAMLEKPHMSPKLYRHPLNKDKINLMVKSAYTEESDSVKVSRFFL